MSCWVAPKIAAEIWGLSLAEILALIAGGRLTTCIDGGFRFVRLPPFSPSGQSLPREQRPPTFNTVEQTGHADENNPIDQIVTASEHKALAGNDDDESEMGPPPDEDPHDNRIAGWREGRKRAGATRRGPGRPSA